MDISIIPSFRYALFIAHTTYVKIIHYLVAVTTYAVYRESVLFGNQHSDVLPPIMYALSKTHKLHK